MRPCRFYALNRGKEGFRCEYEAVESLRFLYSNDREENDYCNKFCPKFAECVTLAGETFRTHVKKNTVVNDFGDGRKEVVVYKKDFKVPTSVINDTSDKTRCFKLINMDFLFPVKENATPSHLRKCIARSAKHSLDNFKGYALSNKWTYFFTFTFSPQLVEGRNNDFVIRELWRKQQLRFKHADKGCEILIAPEPHKDGSRHYHALMNFSVDLPIVDYGDLSKLPQRTCTGGLYKGRTGFCTFTPEGTFTVLPKTSYKVFLMPYYEYGVLQKSKLGDKLFCINIYPYGRNSCAILPGDDTNQLRVGNYLSVYMLKDGNSQYNQKRFIRTRNVRGKMKFTLHLAQEDVSELVEGSGLKMFKENDKMIVYRNFNTDLTPAFEPKENRLKR